MLFCMWTVWIPWVEVVHLILGHWIRATDEFVELYKQKTGHSIVEPAHMVLDELKLLFSKTEPPFTSLVKIALSSWDVSYSDPINPLQVHLYCGIVTSRLTKKLCSRYFLRKSCVSAGAGRSIYCKCIWSMCRARGYPCDYKPLFSISWSPLEQGNTSASFTVSPTLRLVIILAKLHSSDWRPLCIFSTWREFVRLTTYYPRAYSKQSWFAFLRKTLPQHRKLIVDLT